MKPYIIDLTNNLIRKNRYDFLREDVSDKEKFLKRVKKDLEIGDIQFMRPETLGKIMCTLETGDVSASQDDLFLGVSFGGSSDNLLRELVALCLAYVIRDRLYDTCPPGVPVYSA